MSSIGFESQWYGWHLRAVSQYVRSESCENMVRSGRRTISMVTYGLHPISVFRFISFILEPPFRRHFWRTEVAIVLFVWTLAHCVRVEAELRTRREAAGRVEYADGWWHEAAGIHFISSLWQRAPAHVLIRIMFPYDVFTLIENDEKMAPELLGFVSEIGLVRKQYPNSVRDF